MDENNKKYFNYFEKAHDNQMTLSLVFKFKGRQIENHMLVKSDNAMQCSGKKKQLWDRKKFGRAKTPSSNKNEVYNCNICYYCK